MSAVADQVLTRLEQRAVDDGVPLDGIDAFIAAQLRVPVSGLYAYLLLCFAAQRYALDNRDAGAVGGVRP